MGYKEALKKIMPVLAGMNNQAEIEIREYELFKKS